MIKITKKYKYVIIIQFFFSYIILNENNNYLMPIIKQHILNQPQINKESKPIYLEKTERDIILTRGRKYLDKCLKIENNRTYEMKENPIITNIIPSYNCEKTIISSIHSAQYQNLSNIEIIIVDDFSQDNSVKIIQNMQINDQRIKLVENKKNRGTLYSRSIGALLSKGIFIMCLDNDDLFFDEDVFDCLYKLLIKDNLDLISFRIVSSRNYFNQIKKMKNYKFFGFKNNLILSQPKLGIWTLKLKNKFKIHDNEIWSKIIRANIYKNAVDKLGIQRYSKNICWAEDTSVNFIIFNLAKSFKYVHKFGYFHLERKSSASYSLDINNKLYGELFFLDIMFDFSKNNSDKNLVINYSFFIKKKYKLNQYINDTNNNYFKSILHKIVNCPLITNKNKKKIKFQFKSFF